MAGRDTASRRIDLRSIEDDEVGLIRDYQNGECLFEISNITDFDPPWAPMSSDEIRAKLEEIRKEDRTTLSGIWSEDGLIGLAYFSARWDTLCPHVRVIIWPDHRRRGYGTEAARMLLGMVFDNYLSHVVSCSVPEFDEGSLAFAESLGFTRQGIMRRAGTANGKFFDSVFLDMLRSEYHEGGGE